MIPTGGSEVDEKVFDLFGKIYEEIQDIKSTIASKEELSKVEQGLRLDIQGLEREMQDMGTAVQGLEREMQDMGTAVQGLENDMRRGNCCARPGE